ncbi:MAG TPA: NACHT domain-containing protein [Thermoanaerobaculia bacterium]|nr:NACHT domain-containing protein [Thermoanaerobaculia bacterium]
MATTRTRNRSGALPSNAGDRYHLVYVARRLLDLLHPYSGLTQVVIENVAPGDERGARSPSSFLGVDLAEYYGGLDAATASRVDLVQVKYSPLRPQDPWTLSRLTERKRGGASVLRKLAAMYTSLVELKRDHGPHVTVRLLTNQPLSRSLREHVQQLRTLAEGKPHLAAARALASASGPAGRTAKKLKDGTSLTWSRLAQLLGRWDLEAFQHQSLEQSEAQLFERLSGMSSQGGDRLELLLGSLQARATPGQKSTYDRRAVLATLRLREDQIQPAPTVFAADPSHFETASSREVRKAIEAGVSHVIVHGRSGSGKSTSLRLALQGYCGDEAVLYDCYADGKGILPGQERFPYKKCFTQVINDLDARYRTGVLATVELDYDGLFVQLRLALSEASRAAAERGHRLVLAFDAIDNAAEQMRRSGREAGEPFLPLLCNLPLPPNCTVIVSLRTENLSEVDGATLRDAHSVEIQGFEEEETRAFAARIAPVLGPDEVTLLHERTSGNPRVQSKVLPAIVARPEVDPRTIIEETARRTAFQYYDQEKVARLAQPPARFLLALLYEMRQAPRLADVAALAGLQLSEARATVASLSYGLRLSSDDTVGWSDQDFLDWVGQRLEEERSSARTHLADYCLEHFEGDEYARWNLSHHLRQANRRRELVAFWKEPGRLEDQIRAAHGQEERVLEDLRAAMLAALDLDGMADAVDLLLRAADIAEGRDAFEHALADNPGVAVAAGLAHLIPGGSDTPSDDSLSRRARVSGEDHLRVAAELACRPEWREAAGLAYARFAAAMDEELARDPERGGRISEEAFGDYARYQVRIRGLRDALEFRASAEPGTWSRLFALAACADWCTIHEPDPLGAVDASTLPLDTKVVGTLGVLAAVDPDRPLGVPLRALDAQDVKRATQALAHALAPSTSELGAFFHQDARELYQPGVPDRVVAALVSAAENLAAAGFLDAARTLVQAWSPSLPTYLWGDEVIHYLRWVALREALTGATFDATTVSLGSQRPQPKKARDQIQHQQESREVKEIRDLMTSAYPSIRVRASAWIGAEPEELLSVLHRQAEELNRRYFDHQRGWGPERTESFLLDAILALPGSHVELARSLIRAAEAALGKESAAARVIGADIASRDPRYLHVADSLIRQELQCCHPPEVPASTAVDRLLTLYEPAVRIDRELARKVMLQAREVASEIDSRIYARAGCLVALMEDTKAEMEPDRLDQLCRLTAYWWKAAPEGLQSLSERALALLAGQDPGAAVTRAWELDEQVLLDFEEGLGHVAASALRSRSLSPDEVWPTLPFLRQAILDEVAQTAIVQLRDQGLSADATLRNYCRLARREAAAFDPLSRARRVASWGAEVGLGDHPEIAAMALYAERLDVALAKAEPQWPRRTPEGESFGQDQRVPVLQAMLQQVPHDPRAVLATLQQTPESTLLKATETEIAQLVETLLQGLPLGDRCRLAAVIQRWGAYGSWRGLEAIDLLDSLLEEGGTEEPIVVSAVADAVGSLLTSSTLALSANPYIEKNIETVLAGRWAPTKVRLRTILGTAAQSLPDLTSDTLFSLAAPVAKLLPLEERAAVTKRFLDRTLQEARSSGSAAVPGKSLPEVIPHALALALGHPRQELRWRAVHAVALRLVETHDPEALLRPLLDVLDSSDLPRWLSVREWLAFALEHVSIRRPQALLDAGPRLVPHALSTELPHAKIRHHLKQALLAIEEHYPGSLDLTTLELVQRVNRPVQVVQRETGFARDGYNWHELIQELPQDDVPPVEELDSLRYWYDRVVDCFAGPKIEVARSALQHAHQWMTRLGIDRKSIQEEGLKVESRYKWHETTNDHGSQPHVELLRLYGERHALYLAAGALIDASPVRATEWREPNGNEWDDWARFNLRGADPEIVSRLVDAPPVRADNYGVFHTSVEEWRRKGEENLYLAELELDGEPDWIVIHGMRSVYQEDRSCSARVVSALVSSRTARALASLLEMDGRDAFLPTYRSTYDRTLVEVEANPCEEERVERPESALNELAVCGDRFDLRPWVTHFYQEAPLHHVDPWWPETSRHLSVPASDVVRRLGLRRDPAGLIWRDAAGTVVARCDPWRSVHPGGHRSAEGHRLVMRREAVAAYAGEAALEVIFSVKVARQGSSTFNPDTPQDFDRGSTRCFLWSSLSQAGGNPPR